MAEDLILTSVEALEISTHANFIAILLSAYESAYCEGTYWTTLQGAPYALWVRLKLEEVHGTFKKYGLSRMSDQQYADVIRYTALAFDAKQAPSGLPYTSRESRYYIEDQWINFESLCNRNSNRMGSGAYMLLMDVFAILVGVSSVLSEHLTNATANVTLAASVRVCQLCLVCKVVTAGKFAVDKDWIHLMLRKSCEPDQRTISLVDHMISFSDDVFKDSIRYLKLSLHDDSIEKLSHVHERPALVNIFPSRSPRRLRLDLQSECSIICKYVDTAKDDTTEIPVVRWSYLSSVASSVMLSSVDLQQ